MSSSCVSCGTKKVKICVAEIFRFLVPMSQVPKTAWVGHNKTGPFQSGKSATFQVLTFFSTLVNVFVLIMDLNCLCLRQLHQQLVSYLLVSKLLSLSISLSSDYQLVNWLRYPSILGCSMQNGAGFNIERLIAPTVILLVQFGRG